MRGPLDRLRMRRIFWGSSSPHPLHTPKTVAWLAGSFTRAVGNRMLALASMRQPIGDPLAFGNLCPGQQRRRLNRAMEEWWPDFAVLWFWVLTAAGRNSETLATYSRDRCVACALGASVFVSRIWVIAYTPPHANDVQNRVIRHPTII